MKLNELRPGMRVRTVGTQWNLPRDYIVLSTTRVAKSHGRGGSRAVFTLDGKTYAMPLWWHVPTYGAGNLIPVLRVGSSVIDALPLGKLAFEVTDEQLERDREREQAAQRAAQEARAEREARAADFPAVERELARLLGDAKPRYSHPEEKQGFTAHQLFRLIQIAINNNKEN